MNKLILDDILKELSDRLPKFPDGRIDYSSSNKAAVLNCFVKYGSEILLLKRSQDVRAYKGLWNSVAGYLDEIRPLEEKVHDELLEETGITSEMIKKTKFGQPFEVIDNKIEKTWVVFPALVELNIKPAINLDWEHTEYKWINPLDLHKFDTIPNLEQTLNNVL